MVSDSPDGEYNLGTQDGRMNPGSSPTSYYSSITNYEKGLAEQEAAEMAARQKKRRHVVIPGNNPPRIPLTRQFLMAMQGYNILENEWDRSNPVKKASVDRLPTQEITIRNGGRERVVKVYALTDPYDDLRKFLFEDCYRSDPVIRRCLNLEADLVLGTRTMSILDIDEEFTADQLAAGIKQKRVSQALSPEKMEALQTEIGIIDRDVKLRTKMKAAMIQAGIGGRSVLEKVLDSEGLPVDVKILNWKKLGKVYIDPVTWKLIAIEYADRPEDEPLLPEEIIHFEVDDFHVTPDTLYHGLSKVEPVAAVSEINRLLDEADLKEIAKSHWSPSILFKFPLDTDRAAIQEFMASWTPGSANGTDIDVIQEQIENKGDTKSLFELRGENDRRETRNFGTPNPVVGFENITNRATIDTTLRFYFDTEVRDLRTWLQDTMEPQWYQPILKILAPELSEEPRVPMNSLSQDTRVQLAAVQQPVQPPPPPPSSSVLERRRTSRQKQKPRVKVKLEFEDVSIEPFTEKVTALLQLYNVKLITPKEIMKRLDMPHLTEEIELMQEEAKKEEEQKYKDTVALQKQSIDVGRQRMGQRFQSQSQKAVKTASIADQIDLNYRIQNQLGQVNLLNTNKEHEAKMMYLEMKRKALADINERIEEDLAKGNQ